MIFHDCGPRNSGRFCNLLSNSYCSVVSKVFSRSVIPGCYQALEGWSRWCFNTDLSFTIIVSKQKHSPTFTLKNRLFLSTSLYMIFGGNIATVVWCDLSHQVIFPQGLWFTSSRTCCRVPLRYPSLLKARLGRSSRKVGKGMVKSSLLVSQDPILFQLPYGFGISNGRY